MQDAVVPCAPRVMDEKRRAQGICPIGKPDHALNCLSICATIVAKLRVGIPIT